MEAAPNADLRNLGVVTNCYCRLVQPDPACELLQCNAFGRNSHQCGLSSSADIVHHLPEVWLSLVTHNSSQASRSLVPLDDGASQMSRLWIS